MLVGAGTVLTTEQVDRAVAAGAKFIVSPGLNPRIVKYCVDKGILITPGCSNASDIEQALEPMFTTKPERDRSGMGFSFMEAFMDELEVTSIPGDGTIVVMKKKLGTDSWLEE